MTVRFTKREALSLGAGVLAALATQNTAEAATAIRFWVSHTSTPELTAAMRGILQKFMQEHPDITVTYEPISGALVYPKFLTAVQGQALPDIADAYTYHNLQFAAIGQMADADDIMAEWEKNGTIQNVVSEWAYKKNYWNGHYWGVPWNLDIRTIYYRKDLLDKAGLKPPQTWDELVTATQKTHDPASGTFGFVYPAGKFVISQHYYFMCMLQAGGSILDKDGNLVFGSKSRDANIRALRFLTDFSLKHKVTPEGVSSYNTDDPNTLFVQGRAAFATGTGAVIARLIKENPSQIPNVGILPPLEGPAGPSGRKTIGFFNDLFMWKFSPNPEAAKTLARWLVQPGQLQPLYKAFPGQLWPIMKSEFDSEVFKNIPLMPEMLKNAVPYAVDLAYPSFGRPEMGVIDGQGLLAAAVNEVASGAKTPEKAVDDAHAVMVKLFAG